MVDRLLIIGIPSENVDVIGSFGSFTKSWFKMSMAFL